MRAVGAGRYGSGGDRWGEVPSENWIRDEWGMPERTKYSGYDFNATRETLFA